MGQNLHGNIAEIRTAEGKLYLYVAIDPKAEVGRVARWIWWWTFAVCEAMGPPTALTSIHNIWQVSGCTA